MTQKVTDLGMAIVFGPYKVSLAKNGQVSYYKNGSLSKVIDKAIDFDSKDLYAHVSEMASRMGYKVSDLKKGQYMKVSKEQIATIALIVYFLVVIALAIYITS